MAWRSARIVCLASMEISPFDSYTKIKEKCIFIAKNTKHTLRPHPPTNHHLGLDPGQPSGDWAVTNQLLQMSILYLISKHNVDFFIRSMGAKFLISTPRIKTCSPKRQSKMKERSHQKTEEQNFFFIFVSANPIGGFYKKDTENPSHCAPNSRSYNVESARKVDPFAKCGANDVHRGKRYQDENGLDQHRCPEEKAINLVKPNQVINYTQFGLWGYEI